jgi:hypothetical protein
VRKSDPFLAADLRTLAAATCDTPVDPVTLAEYLDRALDSREESRVEEHLARCCLCRQVATEAALAIAEDTGKAEVLNFDRGRPRKIWVARRWSGRLLATAAVLFSLLGAGFWLRSWQQADLSERLATVGVDEATFLESSSSLLARARKALDGELGDPALFGKFLDAERRSALRGASVMRSPEPISPRWSVVRETRPTFRWYLPLTDSKNIGPLHGEIMLVDDHEQLVAALPFELAPDTLRAPTELTWPAERASLEVGRVYAWKVNTEVNGEWLSSEYVPFQIHAETTRRLTELPSNEFLASVDLASLGLYEEALEQLAQATMLQGGEATRLHLLRAILTRKRCSTDLTERELQRWLLNAP